MKRYLSAAVWLILLATTATAQTAPTASEVAAYEGLFRAAHEGDIAAIRVALAAGANVNATDQRQRTPAHVAAFASQDGALEVLAGAGIDMNALEYRLYDVVTIAAVAGDPDLVALAIRLGNRPDLVTSVYQGTALIAAAHLGHHRVVGILVAAGAPLDHVNNLGWTALIEAVILGNGGPDHVKSLQILVDAGAKGSIADRDGQTPLALARARGFAEMVQILEAAAP